MSYILFNLQSVFGKWHPTLIEINKYDIHFNTEPNTCIFLN